MTDDEFYISISKEQLAELPLVEYTGDTVVLSDSTRLADAINDLKRARIIGFDTETRPAFKRGVHNNVALMQLATSEKCYLFRLNHIGLADELIEILENPEIIKIGVSIHDDFLNLTKMRRFSPTGCIDLQQYVKQYKIQDNALPRIYGILFGKRISKAQRLSNWEAENLSQAQIKYASLDALACIQIYKYLENGEFVPEKSPYLHYPEPEDTQE